MNYEELLVVSDSNNLIVKEKPLDANNGRIKGRKIAIKQDMTLTEKACVLAEELGHYYTTTGDIIDQSSTANRKQELHARLWAYNKMIGLMGIVSAYKAGCRGRNEIAEFLDVTEEFLGDSIRCYTSKFGSHTKIDNYIIFFEPVAVMELFG